MSRDNESRIRTLELAEKLNEEWEKLLGRQEALTLRCRTSRPSQREVYARGAAQDARQLVRPATDKGCGAVAWYARVRTAIDLVRLGDNRRQSERLDLMIRGPRLH